MTFARACAILNVSDTATLEVARRAFKRLAHSAHPDRGGSNARFVELTEAWDTFQSLRHKGGKAAAPKEPEPQASVNFGLGSMMQVAAVRVAQVRHEAAGLATLRMVDDALALEIALSTPLSVSLAEGERVLVEMSFQGYPVIMVGAMAQAAYDDAAGKAMSWLRLVGLARV